MGVAGALGMDVPIIRVLFSESVWKGGGVSLLKTGVGIQKCMSGIEFIPVSKKVGKRGSYMVRKINMRVCPRLEFDNIVLND